MRRFESLGRSPVERLVLLLVGAAVAFALGRWSGDGASSDAPREIPPTVSGTPLVLDGDTLDFNGMRVRLFGIDAFERDQSCTRGNGSRYPCGQAAREALVVAISHAPVRCERRDVDRYNRMVAVCRTRNGDLSARVVEQGYALAYRQYSHDYVNEEDAARRDQRGAWSGEFQPPWDYRRNRQSGKK